MNDATLITELTRQYEAARQYFEQNAEAEARGVFVDGPQPNIPELTAVLKEHPVFGQGRSIFFAKHTLHLQPQMVPYGLLRMMLDSDAASAVNWLHDVFKVERADLRMVAEVHGLQVKQPLDLSNGVKLLPFTDAPNSGNLRSLARRYSIWPMREVLWLPTIAVLEMPSVAVSTDYTSGQEAAHDSAFGAILDAARAFTLSDKGAPVVGISWTEFLRPELQLAGCGSQQWFVECSEGSRSQMSPLYVDDEALSEAESYLKMKNDEFRNSVSVALDRLNLARRRRSPGDQAIDSGICLEALLGDKNKEEITYRLGLRAALLLGTTLPERKQIREDVKKLYNLRSNTVHGRPSRPKDKLGDSQCASRGLELCTQAVRAVVKRNAPIDFATWELNGGGSNG